MTLNKLQKIAHQVSQKNGFYDGALKQRTDIRIASLLCLIHSEVSEALEDLRRDNMQLSLDADGKPVGFPTELADIVIRTLDLAEWLGIDLNSVINQKNEYNAKRTFRHGKKL
jgi:NTP pyrophosphatase (non-canonical NTP hydrolase)